MGSQWVLMRYKETAVNSGHKKTRKPSPGKVADTWIPDNEQFKYIALQATGLDTCQV
jgi:hypothetical protein